MILRFPSISLLLLLGVGDVESFSLSRGTSTVGICHRTSSSLSLPPRTSSATALYAKKKKGGAASKAKDAALAALEALEASENAAAAPPAAAAAAPTATLDWDEEDEPLSKKEQMALEKKRQKEAKKQQKEQERAAAAEKDEMEKNKRKKALKALAEMEAMEKASGTINSSSTGDEFGEEAAAPLSKKEQKMAAKKAAKEAEKQAKKMKKKQAKKLGISVEELEEREAAGELDLGGGANGATEDANGINGDAAAAVAEAAAPPVNGDAAAPASAVEEPPKKKRLTAEEKIRKERPPPRIRVMESSQPDYTALRLENIAITFRDQPVLKSATWGVQTGDRIGLVGANGAGKTTQLRILAGELEPTAGDVVKSSKDLRVAMLRQEFIDEIDLTRSLREEFMSVFTEEAEIMASLAQAEKELEGMTGTDDADQMQEVLDRMAKLQAKADTKNVGALDSRVSKIMDLMGFEPEEGDYEVSMFSGGWKMRIGLGKVLLKDPNILLLDEPTNHLDLESVEWLEAFLRNQNLPMVIVSHDREFLDQVCTKIVDAEGGLCTEYNGNYSKFLQLKKARMDSWNAAYNAQEKKIKEERQWINKFRLKQPQAVKQREAQLEKLQKSADYVQKPPFVGKPFRFRFPPAPRLSPEVAEVRGLSHGYGDSNLLFKDSDLFIEKGDRIAVIGPNGAGKSTLLRILMGKEEPDEGSAQIVGQNVYPAYFEQNQADVLDLDKTVVDTVQGASHGQSYNELRALLGQFLFKGDSVEKKVENLSGGEKARLSLCCMMLKESNLLILDEPTNHLDIPAKEMLEEALQHFDGSVVVISHDRYFISKVATTIVAIEDKKLVKYGGDYKFYMDKSKHVKEKVEARYFAGGARIGAAPVIDLEELNKPKKNFGGAKNANMVTRKDKGVKNAKRNKQK
jgi:ATPase subunit of ABC transporter with duplicated ATPase domains